MAYWLTSHSGPRMYRELHRVKLEFADMGMSGSLKADVKKLVEKAMLPFYGYAIVNIRAASNTCYQEQVLMTYFANYHGLSRNGIALMAGYGYLTKLSRFDIGRQKLFVQALRRLE